MVSGAGLVLASASPRRLALLAQIGVAPVEVIGHSIDETPTRDENPRIYAERMAQAKAAASPRPGQYLLAADTVVAVGRRILPKTDDDAAARQALTLLSGRRHRVITCVVVVAPSGKPVLRVVESNVTLARLETARIDAYLTRDEWRGKAGSYAIQGFAAAFVRAIGGSYSNVVGLPLFETAQLLRGLGYPLA